MPLFVEDECCELLEELLGTPSNAALLILKSPQKKQPELLDLYYQAWNVFCVIDLIFVTACI